MMRCELAAIAPDDALPQDSLIQALWPDERMVGDSAAGRLHSTITQLRALGLRELVARDDAGYRLQPGTFVRLWDAGGLPEFLSF